MSKIVNFANAGASFLIANRTTASPWEQFQVGEQRQRHYQP